MMGMRRGEIGACLGAKTRTEFELEFEFDYDFGTRGRDRAERANEQNLRGDCYESKFGVVAGL
jgi:hypothetical protein